MLFFTIEILHLFYNILTNFIHICKKLQILKWDFTLNIFSKFKSKITMQFYKDIVLDNTGLFN